MNTNKQLSGKTAIVTGASSGYGLGIAQALKAAGATVWITARKAEQLQQVADSLQVNYQVADVSKPDDWDELMTTITTQGHSLDILVNNAGGGLEINDITEQSDENIKSSIEVNLLGAIYGSKRAARLMIQQKSGIIINISSICSVQAWPGWSVYAAAKAGLEQFSRSLYVDLRPHQVRATCITPSWGNTAFNTSAGLPAFNPETAAQAIQPEDLGKIILDTCLLPPHLVIPEMIVLPLVQEIVPY